MPEKDPTTVRDVPIHDGKPLNREGALYLRERMAHRQGFELGYERAVSQLREVAATRWLDRFEDLAVNLRDTADRLLDKRKASTTEYGDELDGVDFAACRALLLGEEVSR